MSKVITIVIALLIIHLTKAQTINGVVLDENELPLTGAYVYWSNTINGTSTNEKGGFSIEKINESNRLVISFIGYRSDTILVNNNVFLTIHLKQGETLEEIEVVHRANSTTIDYLSARNTQIMGKKELKKAACCNLSESFETNPSIDVSFTDAVTGTKQIQMLGLAGKYSLISRENMPAIRGLFSNVGLSFIPGSWIESIQVTKGAGQIANGFESMTGQINVELKKPKSDEKFFINLYTNQGGRTEFNANSKHKISEKLSTSFLAHASKRFFYTDMNKDKFMDFPLAMQLNAMNRWKYESGKGLEAQLGFHALYDEKIGGQIQSVSNPYLFSVFSNRYEMFGKTGYVFPNKEYQSIGFQFSGTISDLNSRFNDFNYKANQKTLYANLMYVSIIGNTNNEIKIGASFLNDTYFETLDSLEIHRNELVPGGFLEYTYNYLETGTLVLASRADYHNMYGWLISPRFHSRYAFNENLTLRLSAGKGYRISNIFSDNLSSFASSRKWVIQTNSIHQNAYGLQPEESINFGGSITQDFKLDYRDGYISVDIYNTYFVNQIVIDYDKNPQELNIYNLKGNSSSLSAQVEVSYELIKRLDAKIAYRFLDVKTDYQSNNNLENPLISKHRAFLNLGYESRTYWNFDVTVQWHGMKRIPNTETNPEAYQLPTYSKSFFVVNTQISKTIQERTDIYLGVENATNFVQKKPIIASETPNSSYFDSTLVWGPIFGRMVYAGLRWTIK